MCFMDDQVKLGPCGGKGRLGTASAGDGDKYHVFLRAVFHMSFPFTCALLAL